MTIVYLVIIAVLLLYITTMLASLIVRVPYVPTKKRVMHKILKEAGLKNGDNFYDLGCGDGRVVIEAGKLKKINAHGYEIAPLVYFMALFRKLIHKSKAKIHFKNFFHENLKEADIIFCYLMPRELAKLAKKIKKECKQGTRIISNTFKIKGLKPVRIIKKDEKTKIPTLYFYKI